MRFNVTMTRELDPDEPPTSLRVGELGLMVDRLRQTPGAWPEDDVLRDVASAIVRTLVEHDAFDLQFAAEALNASIVDSDGEQRGVLRAFLAIVSAGLAPDRTTQTDLEPDSMQ